MKMDIKNELTLERTPDLMMFLALLFDSLTHIELPYRPSSSKEEMSQYGFYVPKKESEIIKLDFDYKALLRKVENCSDSKQKELVLNKEEILIFKKAMDYAYNFFINREFKCSPDLFVRYYEKHFAELSA